MTNAVETVSETQIEEWVIAAAKAADDKKAADIVVLKVASLLNITDAFVIASASNSRQVKTIAEEIEQRIKEIGGPAPLRIEGLADASWILMDYGDFVVHIFLEETREFYDLERLWSDAPRIDWA